MAYKILLGALLIAVVGCTTIQSPDGSRETTVDRETAIAMAELALTHAETAYDLWERWAETQAELEEAEIEREREDREQRIEEIRLLLEQLRAVADESSNAG
jgi:hypothetical protein